MKLRTMKQSNRIFMGMMMFITTFLLFSSCQKWEDYANATVDFDGEYAIPIFTANVEVNDILGELDSLTSIELGEDGLVHLIYRGDFTQRSSADIFASLPFLPVPLSDTLIELPYEPPGQMVLDYVIFKSGTIAIDGESNHTENISLTVEMPEITHPSNGQTFKYTTTINYDGSPPTPVQGIKFLDGWKLTPRPDGKIFIRYEAYKPDGTRVFLDDMTLSIVLPKASYLQGYLGQELYDLPRDTIFVDFFDRWIGGGITFADPVINMEVENSFGLPVRSVAHVLDLWTLDGNVLQITGDPIDDGLDFAYPSLNEVGESKFSHFVLDKDNSNIIDVFGQKPIALDYDFDALGNPDGDANIIGFATDSSFFTVHVFIDLPVYGTANMFTVLTDVEVQTDFEEDFEFADYAILKLHSENQIPMDVGLQIYFKTEEGVVLDSLFDVPLNRIIDEKSFIKAASVDAGGYSNSTTNNSIEIEVPREKFDAFKQSKIIGLVTVFDNEPSAVVKLTGQDAVNIKLGAKVGISNE